MSEYTTADLSAQPPFEPTTKLLDALRDTKCWLLFKFENKGRNKQGTVRINKVPYYVGGGKRVGEQGTPEDLKRLATYDEAIERFNRGGYAGLGLATGIETEQGVIQGIDLDGIAWDSFAAPWAMSLIRKARDLGAYVELSPSGTGAHILGIGKPFKKLTNNGSGVEAFAAGQFLTFTGDTIEDGCVDLSPLHELAEQEWTNHAGENGLYIDWMQSQDRVRHALKVLAEMGLPDGERYDWLRVGMALHRSSGAHPDALKQWKEWSNKATNPDYLQDIKNGICEREWRSFKPNGKVTLGTLFHMAGLSRRVAATGEHDERQNVVGLIERVRAMQEVGDVPLYWTCSFDHRIRIGTPGDMRAERYDEKHDIKLMLKFHEQHDPWVKKSHAADVIKELASERVINPLALMMESYQWDGTPRLETWLIRYMGAEDNAYTRAVGRKWLISIAARAMQPGCQADHMLILEGEQGIGKSQCLRALGGDFYIEYSRTISGNNTGHKDMVAAINGKLVVEMSELATIRRADMETLKAILTTTADEARLAYDRDSKSFPRTCVFAGTTNELEGGYIADYSGARRFWPVRVGVAHKPDIAALRAARDQLLAEAVHVFEQGEDWYVVPQDMVKAEQAERQVHAGIGPMSVMRSALTNSGMYGTECLRIVEYNDAGVPQGSSCVYVHNQAEFIQTVYEDCKTEATTALWNALKLELRKVGIQTNYMPKKRPTDSARTIRITQTEVTKFGITWDDVMKASREAKTGPWSKPSDI